MTARLSADIQRYEMIERVIADMRQQSDNGAAIVVEGRRDVSALRNLGVCGTIVTPNGQPLMYFTDTLACSYDSVIVLTDWDRKGNELSSRIVTYLRSCDVATDTTLRTRLKKLVQKDIKDVEGLDRHILRLQENVIKRTKQY